VIGVIGRHPRTAEAVVLARGLEFVEAGVLRLDVLVCDNHAEATHMIASGAEVAAGGIVEPAGDDRPAAVGVVDLQGRGERLGLQEADDAVHEYRVRGRVIGEGGRGIS
jgi:hypothetical protein